VITQWRRWCLAREYVVGAEGEHVRAAYASVRIPILSLSFTDDEMMSAQGIRSLHALYSGAPIQYRQIAPSDVGVARIGHFGFFRPQFEGTLWPIVKEWIKKSVRNYFHNRARLHPIDGSGGLSTIIVSKLKSDYRKRLRYNTSQGRSRVLLHEPCQLASRANAAVLRGDRRACCTCAVQERRCVRHR
jgi:hypothetical protein